MTLLVRSLLLVTTLCRLTTGQLDNNNDCISDLEEVLNGQLVAPKDDAQKEFVLCPNAQYISPSGRALLEIFTSDTIVTCGHDGSSRNNCILRGVGLRTTSNQSNHGYQVVVASGSNEKVEHVEFRGITFTDMTVMGRADQDGMLGDVSVLVENDASVRFVDCHWVGNVGETLFTTIVKPTDMTTTQQQHHRHSSHRPQQRRRRQQQNRGTWHYRQRELISEEKQNRQLLMDTKFRSNVQVEFHECTFTDNVLLFGALTNTFADVVVSDCVFDKNKMTYSPTGFSKVSDFTFVIDTYFGTLNVTRSCFIGNQNVLAPIVIEYSTHSLRHNFAQNNALSPHENGCDNAFMVTSGSLLEDSFPKQMVYACLEFDKEKCHANVATLKPPPLPEIVDVTVENEDESSIPAMESSMDSKEETNSAAPAGRPSMSWWSGVLLLVLWISLFASASVLL